jgi:drug/metabolite transporter (DMT)-like permease
MVILVKLKSTQVLALRFWMLWLFSLGLALYFKQLAFSHYHYLPKILFVSLITLLIPVYFLQKAMEKIGTSKTGIYVGLIPFTVVIIEIGFLHQHPEFIIPAIIHAVIIFINQLFMKK